MKGTELQTPCYVVDRDRLEENLKVLRGVMERTGCRILLAQKAFSCYAVYPLISKYLCGATASGLFEARLCHEEMPGRENHVFSPAFREEDFLEILSICDFPLLLTLDAVIHHGAKLEIPWEKFILDRP